MYPIRCLTTPVREFLLARLEGLQISLNELAARLRESIARVVGSHFGDTVSEVVRAILNRRLPDNEEDDHELYGEHSRYSPYEYDSRPSPWYRREPMAPPAAPSVTAWLPVVPPALQGLAWLLEPVLKRWPWLGLLGVSTAAVLVAVLCSPWAGALTGTGGIALLLLRAGVGNSERCCSSV